MPAEPVQAGSALLGDQLAHPILPPGDVEDVQASGRLCLQPPLRLYDPPGIGHTTVPVSRVGACKEGGGSFLLDVEDSTPVARPLTSDQHGVAL